MWILVGCGVADLFLAGLGDPDALLALPAGLPLSLDPERDLLLGGGEGDALFLGASTPPSPLVGSTGRLAGGEDPGSLSTSGFLGPGFPFDSLLDFLLFLFLSSLSLLLLESELESLLESLELSLLELELELLAFLFFCPLSSLLFSLLLPFLFSLSSSLLSEELPPLLLLLFFSCFSLPLAWSPWSVVCLSLSSPGGSTPPPVDMVFK